MNSTPIQLIPHLNLPLLWNFSPFWTSFFLTEGTPNVLTFAYLPKPFQLQPKQIVGSNPVAQSAEDEDHVLFSLTPVLSLFPQLFNQTLGEERSKVALGTSGTPGSELPLYYRSQSKLEFVWGRDGNDFLLGVEPIPYLNQSFKLSLLLGDGQTEGQEKRNWQDTFILGDWRRNYYQDYNPLVSSPLGLNRFAVLMDFNPDFDTIQLYGQPEDYILIQTPDFADGLFYSLYFRQGETVDLTALIVQSQTEPFGLDLSAPYFDFQGDQSPEPSLRWDIEQVGTAGYDALNRSDVDRAGNLYLGGMTSGSLDRLNGGGAYDGILRKYNPQGQLEWSQQIGTDTLDAILGVAASQVGAGVYVVGATYGDFAASPQGLEDVFVIKYDGNGQELWRQQFGTALVDVSFSLTVDAEDNVFLAGYTVEELEQEGTFTDDSWVTKYDSLGQQQWFVEFGSDSFDEAYGVTVDNQGYVYATGWTTGSLGGANLGLYDVWLTKLDPSGGQVWLTQFGTDTAEFPWDVAVDGQGNTYTTGWTLGNFNGQKVGSYDVFLSKHDSNGQLLWVKLWGTEGDDGAYGLTIDESRNLLYLTGYTNGNFWGTHSGSYDAWAAQLDSNGNPLWGTQWGTAAMESGKDITFDRLTGSVYVTGITDGAVGTTNQGSFDGWTARLEAGTGQLQDFQGRSREIKTELRQEEGLGTKGPENWAQAQRDFESLSAGMLRSFNLPGPQELAALSLPSLVALSVGEGLG